MEVVFFVFVYTMRVCFVYFVLHLDDVIRPWMPRAIFWLGLRCTLSLRALPASYTSGQPPNPRWHSTCWASSQWSHTVSSTPCHGAWTSAPLGAHLATECKCKAPQIETHICTRCTTTHQLIWGQQQHTCGAVGGSPVDWGVGGQNHKTPHFHTRHRHPPGMTLPKRARVRLNRLRTGVGRFRSCLYKWVMAPSAACECGAEEQTVDHVVHRPHHGLHCLTVLDDETIEWLLDICPKI